MTTPIDLIPDRFAPSTSLTGGAGFNIFRGKNCRLRGVDGKPRVVAFSGCKDLGFNYDIVGETLADTLTTTPGSNVVEGGPASSFTTALHRGQMILIEKGSATEVAVVNRIIDDTHFEACRPMTESIPGGDGYYLPGWTGLIDNKRGLLRRGNAIRVDRGDVIFVGDGNLYLNGLDSGFTATRRPKRLAKQTDGTYIENPLGYDAAPPKFTVDGTTGGTRGMLAGNYSFLFSYYNSQTKGFSNPSEPVKYDSGGASELVIASFGRFKITATLALGIKTFTDATPGNDVTIATGEIAITGHGYSTGDAVKLQNYSGALPVAASGGGLTELRTYYIIRVNADKLKLARTEAEADAGTAITYASAAGGGTHVIYKIPANADGFRVWQSASGGGNAAVNDANFANGNWYYAADILLSDLDVTHQAYVDCVDAQLGAIASGNNDAPPECEFVTEFANFVIYLSALGNTTNTSKNGTSPGNYVLCQKQSNREAAPFDWAVSMGDEVTGFAPGLGRLFCLTDQGIPFLTATGRQEISRLVPTLLDDPFTSRPFWTKGGVAPGNITTVQGDVFVWSGGKLLMSPRNADQYANPFELSGIVDDLAADWADGHVILKNDPYNQQLCIISAATRQNDAGYWISEILPLDLNTNTWQPIIELSSDTRDMIVSAAAVVDGRLELIVGGRDGVGGYEMRTMRYDESDGVAVPYYFALQPTDLGEEERKKSLKWIRATGRMTSPVVQIHGVRDDGTFSFDDVEDGTNPLYQVALDTSAGIERQFKKKFLVTRLQNWLVRFSGTWAGSGDPDRIDEIVVGAELHGKR